MPLQPFDNVCRGDFLSLKTLLGSAVFERPVVKVISSYVEKLNLALSWNLPATASTLP